MQKLRILTSIETFTGLGADVIAVGGATLTEAVVTRHVGGATVCVKVTGRAKAAVCPT